MKTAIFAGLVWAASAAATRFPAAGLAGSRHLLLTLRGWAIMALILSVLLQMIRRERFHRRHLKEAAATFGLFSGFVGALIFAFHGGPQSETATLLTLAGGVLAPVMALMALEFADLRPATLALGAILGTAVASCAFAGILVSSPAQGHGLFRTKQPPSPVETPRPFSGTARA